ncbi:MAG: ClpXP protease specificity-enhancing factor [Gammaproteobacteria bacterium]|nr:ClpXP protease specificity-enhancing factor [Gammaproteobacteria bacterium]
MTSSRPYLIRAMHEWIVDNGMTPHILADASNDQVQVPRQFEEDGKIVLNIGPTAVQSLDLGADAISFDARFDGKQMTVFIPIQSVLAIYTRENGQGMMFAEEDLPPTDDSQDRSANPKSPHLRLVK